MALVIGDNFSYQGKKPLDGRIEYNDVATMKAVADATMYEGCIAFCKATGKTYQWKSTNEVDETLGKWREFTSGGGGGGTEDYADLDNKPQVNGVTLSGNKTSADLKLQSEMQVTSLPTAGIDYLGKVYQYVGATGSGLTHNYYYECVSDGQSTPTYSWQATNVQEDSAGHVIEDSEGTALTQRETLQFGEGFKAEDDDTNEKTVISPDVMQSGDMDDVVTPLPSVQSKYHKYSTEEQIVGEWIDGSKIYEKTIPFDVSTYTESTNRRVFTLCTQENVSKRINYVINELIVTLQDTTTNGAIIGSSMSSDGSTQFNTASQISNSTFSVFFQFNRQKASDIVAVQGYVTLQYTKTT